MEEEEEEDLLQLRVEGGCTHHVTGAFTLLGLRALFHELHTSGSYRDTFNHLSCNSFRRTAAAEGWLKGHGPQAGVDVDLAAAPQSLPPSRRRNIE